MKSAASISHATSHTATSANGVHQGAGDRSRLDNSPSKQNCVTLWWSRQKAREGGASFRGPSAMHSLAASTNPAAHCARRPPCVQHRPAQRVGCEAINSIRSP